MNKKLKHLIFSALIGSAYAALTILFAPISYGPIQIRVSEALTILPYFSFYSIWGLFIGCILANIFGGNGILDIIFGSIATLASAILTYYIGKSKINFKRYIAPLPAVIINAIVVGFLLSFLFKMPFIITALWVGLGEFISAYVLGLPLLIFLDNNSKFKNSLKN